MHPAAIHVACAKWIGDTRSGQVSVSLALNNLSLLKKSKNDSWRAGIKGHDPFFQSGKDALRFKGWNFSFPTYALRNLVEVLASDSALCCCKYGTLILVQRCLLSADHRIFCAALWVALLHKPYAHLAFK